MPIEDASVEWSERDSPYVGSRELRIPRQAIDDPARPGVASARLQPMARLAEHRPLGGMNRARREIYQAMTDFRRLGR